MKRQGVEASGMLDGDAASGSAAGPARTGRSWRECFRAIPLLYRLDLTQYDLLFEH